MQFEVKELDDIKRQILITVAPEEVREIESNVLKKLNNRISIPGFRRGRSPVSLIKKNFADVIKKEILENAIRTYYTKALDETKLNPISQGAVNIVKFDNVESGIEFEIAIEVEPTIPIKKYKGLKTEKVIPVVTEKMIDAALLDIRKNFATVKSVETSEKGHFISFDIQQLGDGDIPLIGQKIDDVTVEIGAGEFDRDLEEQLIGLAVDQQTILRKTIPPSPGAENKIPKIESYKINIKSIEERELPPVDDELVQNLQDDDLETLDELKERLRHNIGHNLESRSNQLVKSHLIDELLKENPFEVPETMINNYLHRIIHDIRHNHPDERIDEERIRQKYRVDAIYLIRWHLLKKQIAEMENIQVTREEVFQRIDATLYKKGEKKQLKENEDFVLRLADDMLEEKVVNFLKENAEITEVYPADGVEEASLPEERITR
jgi:trigger factor